MVADKQDAESRGIGLPVTRALPRVIGAAQGFQHVRGEPLAFVHDQQGPRLRLEGPERIAAKHLALEELERIRPAEAPESEVEQRLVVEALD